MSSINDERIDPLAEITIVIAIIGAAGMVCVNCELSRPLDNLFDNFGLPRWVTLLLPITALITGIISLIRSNDIQSKKVAGIGILISLGVSILIFLFFFITV